MCGGDHQALGHSVAQGDRRHQTIYSKQTTEYNPIWQNSRYSIRNFRNHRIRNSTELLHVITKFRRYRKMEFRRKRKTIYLQMEFPGIKIPSTGILNSVTRNHGKKFCTVTQNSENSNPFSLVEEFRQNFFAGIPPKITAGITNSSRFIPWI